MPHSSILELKPAWHPRILTLMKSWNLCITYSLQLLTIFTVNQKVSFHHAMQVSTLWLRDFYPFGLAQNRTLWFRNSGVLCCFAMRLPWPSKQITRSILVVLHRQCGMPITKCLWVGARVFSCLKVLEWDGICLYSAIIPAFMSAFVSLKVLEVVLDTVCLLFVRPAAIGYEMNGTDSTH